MLFLCGIETYYNIFGIEKEVYSIYNSFIGAQKNSVTLWSREKVVYDAFY